MKLLAKTNRYYLLLAAGLFALGGIVLYISLNWALRNEVDEELLDQQRALTAALPADSQRVSRGPRPGGLPRPRWWGNCTGAPGGSRGCTRP